MERLNKAQALVDQKRRDVEQALVEHKRLKIFPILALTTPWPALLFSWRLSAALFGSWMLFWVVGHYLNFFHRREARQKLENAENDLLDLKDDIDDARAAASHDATPAMATT
jgi:cbb3-type cytochrome oxidase subunit 3